MMNTNNQVLRYVILLFAVFILVLSTSIHAGVSVWWMRGEGWRTFEKPEKTLYVQGILDGLIFAEGKIQGVKISYKTSLEHFIKALDQFYADYKNELIPVPFALKVISLQLNGTPQSAINEELQRLRQHFHKLKK
ncbi:MAG: hypothetical protein Q8M92_07675 [Candidatus Subteraquimicrobiales bacterium]|nr:hypothetical protein [Candidatus Subteraquimicrobiales bacterium]